MGNGGFTDHCLMFSVAILNLICGILGVLVFGLAIWMRLETDVRDWVHELEMHQYWNGLYILMAASAIVIIISFCGCCGALTNNVLLMTITTSLTCLGFVMLFFGAILLLSTCIRPTFDYGLITEQFNVILNRNDARSDNFIIWLSYAGGAAVCLTLILILAGGILILVHGTQYSKLTPHLTTTLDRLIMESNYNPNSYHYLMEIQEKVGCCGSRNYMDYNKHNLPIADTCRDAISGQVYQKGCVEKLSVFIEKRAGWIAAIAIFVAVLQILLVCFTFCYIRSARGNDEFKDKHRYVGVAQN